MINNHLFAILKIDMGIPLTPELAADICLAADQLTTLMPVENMGRIESEQHGGLAFSIERIEDITDEIKSLHRAHWDETEVHRHELPFNPDYETFIRYERAGRYVLFTLRSEARLLGNCAMYLDKSAHTQMLIATEDTLYLLPEARKGRVAKCFVAYVENAMRLLGVSEINISVKTVNKAERFFRLLGYRHVENGLTKILERSKMCSSKPPKPDPLIGQAAMSNAELAREMAGVARDQLAWEKNCAARQDPLMEKIIGQQIASGDANANRAESQWRIYHDLFAPLEARMVEDASEFDSPSRKERMAGEAAADVSRGYRGALDSSQRALGRLGINPDSGRFQELIQDINLGLARDTAGAMNKARRDTELQGMAMREGAAKFGRNMPNTGLAADAAALNAANSATGNLATAAGLHNAGMNAAQDWFGGATSASTSAGNLGLGQYQGQLDAWRQANQNSALGAAGLGSLLGQLGSAAITKKL